MSADPITIGPYRVVRQLGAGGMGVVYLARDERLDRDVAVKVLMASLGGDAERRARFLREARAAAGISHPNVVAVHASGEDGSMAWLAMEYLEGGSLADRLGKCGKLPPGAALALLRQVVAGLEAAWRKGIVHRDIKPDNILLHADGYAKLADFGLSKVYGSDQRVTADGQVLGTPRYISPEQIEGRTLDFRADIYSLDATFFHLLAGKPPYEGGTAWATVMKHLGDPVPSLAAAEPSVPAPLCRAIERMMQKRPEDRFASYGELLFESQKYEDAENRLDTAARNLESWGVSWQVSNDEVFMLGVAQARLGEKDYARRSFEKCREMTREPDDPVRVPGPKGFVEVPAGKAIDSALAELR